MKLPALGGYSITGNPFLILSALFIITGVQFITNGLLAEMLTRTYYEGGYRMPGATAIGGLQFEF